MKRLLVRRSISYKFAVALSSLYVLDEAKLLSSLRHANIIEMEEVFKSERALYIVLEFMEGGTLDSLIRKRNGKPFDHTVIVRYTVQVGGRHMSMW